MCFLGGTLALATHNGLSSEFLSRGERLTDTCWQMYRRMPTGLSPEIVFFSQTPDSKEDLIVKVRSLKSTMFLHFLDCLRVHIFTAG